MKTKVTCRHCGSTEVKRTFLGGGKAGNVVVVFLCLGAIANSVQGRSAAGYGLVMGWVVVMAFAAVGLLSPKHKCTNCDGRPNSRSESE